MPGGFCLSVCLHVLHQGGRLNFSKVHLEYILGIFAKIETASTAICKSNKKLLAPLIFALNHPLYRKVYMFHDMDLSQMPIESLFS